MVCVNENDYGYELCDDNDWNNDLCRRMIGMM